MLMKVDHFPENIKLLRRRQDKQKSEYIPTSQDLICNKKFTKGGHDATLYKLTTFEECINNFASINITKIRVIYYYSKSFS